MDKWLLPLWRYWPELDGIMAPSFEPGMLRAGAEVLSLIAKIDEFKGAWRAMGCLAADRLSSLRRVATFESIGSSTLIEGAGLSNRDGETLLSNLQLRSFATRD